MKFVNDHGGLSTPAQNVKSRVRGRKNKMWTNMEIRYLLENYEKDGPEAVAAIVKHPTRSVERRAFELRRQGIMPKRAIFKNHYRSRPA